MKTTEKDIYSMRNEDLLKFWWEMSKIADLDPLRLPSKNAEDRTKWKSYMNSKNQINRRLACLTIFPQTIHCLLYEDT